MLDLKRSCERCFRAQDTNIPWDWHVPGASDDQSLISIGVCFQYHSGPLKGGMQQTAGD
jgi:hypothetical protein